MYSFDNSPTSKLIIFNLLLEKWRQKEMLLLLKSNLSYCEKYPKCSGLDKSLFLFHVTGKM